MHVRSPYHGARPTDFSAVPSIAAVLAATPTGRYGAGPPATPSSPPAPFPFWDPAVARAVTQHLLRRDFGLAWDSPLNRLLPPVPGRFNVVLGVQDLVACRDALAGLDAGAPPPPPCPSPGSPTF